MCYFFHGFFMLDWSKWSHQPLVCSLKFKSSNLSVCSYSYYHVYQIHLYYVVGAGNGKHGTYHGFRLLEWHKYLSISRQKCVELGDLRIVTLLGDWIPCYCVVATWLFHWVIHVIILLILLTSKWTLIRVILEEG